MQSMGIRSSGLFQAWALSALLALALFQQPAQADGLVKLDTVRQVLRINLSDQPPYVDTASAVPYGATPIRLTNVGNESVNVTLTPAAAIAKITQLTEDQFSLEPNETKAVDLRIAIPGPGKYEGSILIRVDARDKPGIGYASEVIVFAGGQLPAKANATAKETGRPVQGLEAGAIIQLASIALVVMAVAGIVLLKFRRMS